MGGADDAPPCVGEGECVFQVRFHGRGGQGVVTAAELLSVAAFDVLNPWYYDDAPRTVRPMIEVARRRSTFDEVTGGLDPTTALCEARRCLSCEGCGLCVQQCPCGAIELGPEPI